MRGIVGAALSCVAILVMTGTAHAGYAHVESYAEVGDVPSFDALPHEASDLRIQFSQDGRTVTFQDLANPITPGAPPTGGGAPCQIVSTHEARCTAPWSLLSVNVTTGLREARVVDLEGNADGNPVYLATGPLGDVIDLDDQAAVQVRDDGGPNQITLGAKCACTGYDQTVHVGPGASKIDVRNGALDYVTCMTPPRHWIVDSGSPYPGQYNLLDSLEADPQDNVTGCKTPS